MVIQNLSAGNQNVGIMHQPSFSHEANKNSFGFRTSGFRALRSHLDINPRQHFLFLTFKSNSNFDAKKCSGKFIAYIFGRNLNIYLLVCRYSNFRMSKGSSCYVGGGSKFVMFHLSCRRRISIKIQFFFSKLNLVVGKDFPKKLPSLMLFREYIHQNINQTQNGLIQDVKILQNLFITFFY